VIEKKSKKKSLNQKKDFLEIYLEGLEKIKIKLKKAKKKKLSSRQKFQTKRWKMKAIKTKVNNKIFSRILEFSHNKCNKT
jgi:hypothetical protein